MVYAVASAVFLVGCESLEFGQLWLMMLVISSAALCFFYTRRHGMGSLPVVVLLMGCFVGALAGGLGLTSEGNTFFDIGSLLGFAMILMIISPGAVFGTIAGLVANR